MVGLVLRERKAAGVKVWEEVVVVGSLPILFVLFELAVAWLLIVVLLAHISAYPEQSRNGISHPYKQGRPSPAWYILHRLFQASSHHSVYSRLY